MPASYIELTGDNDAPTPEALINSMNRMIAAGYLVLVKWTCPKCGERCESGEPNVFHAQGYYHDVPGCGALYEGPRYGFAAILASDREMIQKMITDIYGALPEFEGPLPGLRGDA
jgi:hypothetical protein